MVPLRLGSLVEKTAVAERVGFEPTVDLRLRQFSRLVP